MTRKLAILAGMGVLAVASGLALAQPLGNTVSQTPHNLRIPATTGPMTGLVADYGEVCVYCHTPHNANTSVQAPLWNREAPTGPYQMYDQNWSSTIDMTVDSTPTGVSLACLSCHDGTIGLDVILNPPAGSTATAKNSKITACATGCHTGPNPAGGLNFEGTALGTDLRNDHPISIVYDPTKDPKFRPVADVEAGGLVLYNGKVQCGSCHNPHSEQYRPFLRKSNQDSALCLTCHNI